MEFVASSVLTLDPARRERFWGSVERTAECWIWKGSLSVKGYGVFRLKEAGKSRGRFSHRLSYEMCVGPIPAGMVIDHICHMKACVNPKHLRPVTNKQNLENRDGPQRNSKTGVRGVFLTRNGRYNARVKHHQVIHNIGNFRTLKDAEAAVVALRNELFTHNDMDRRAA